MKIISAENLTVKQVAVQLKEGALIIAPSDTVYGLLADARNEAAIKKLTSFKNRPPGKPISIFVSDLAMLKEYAKVNKQSEKVLNELLPGPFTVILPSKGKVSQRLESEKGTLGLRYPNYPFILRLVTEFGSPLTATSANLSGSPPHHKLSALLNKLSPSKLDLIDLVIDAGDLPKNKPSTIIDLTSEKFKLLRKGDIEVHNSKIFTSSSPQQTRKIAEYILGRDYGKVRNRSLVIILKGELGAGKTEFVKGAAHKLGIDNIISPTYVVYYEYKLKFPPYNIFLHADLYNIENDDELKYLKLEQYLKKGNIIFIEWGEKSGKLAEIFKKNAKVVFVSILYIGIDERKITISS